MTAGLLSRPTLVLNRNWQPVGIATVSRTLTKLWNGTARVVDPNDYQIYSWSDWSMLQPKDDEPFIQTTSLRLRVQSTKPFQTRQIYVSVLPETPRQ